MAGARYVLLGLAPARTDWFRDVAQWANAGAIPAEFLKCLSAEEVRARLASGRPFSALLVDGTLPALDRDLVDAARGVGCAVVVVGDARPGRDWTGLGAATTLARGFGRRDLLDALSGHVSLIGRADRSVDASEPAGEGQWRAPVIAVTGPGGTGASTVAIALAQGLGADVRSGGAVVLTDFCLSAEQAMLHDAPDVIPGVQELVETFRAGRPSAEEIRSLTFAVPERHYRLLLGLRRPRSWSTIRPRAFHAALDGLRTTFRFVVADVDADLEGEDDGGSIDVEERNAMARSVLGVADAVFVVGVPGMKGLHSLTRVIAELRAFGVGGGRIVAVINRAPRAARLRGETAETLEQLVPSGPGVGRTRAVFLPDRHVDDALRDNVRLPDALVSPLLSALRSVMHDGTPSTTDAGAPQLVIPGRLGQWTPELERQ